MLQQRQSPSLQQKVKLANLLLRPEVDMEALVQSSCSLSDEVASLPLDLRDDVVRDVEIAVKYQRYIEKEQEVAGRILKFEDVSIPDGIDYFSIFALSYESREKLTKMRPSTIGQASRISGVSPADISVLLIYLNNH